MLKFYPDKHINEDEKSQIPLTFFVYQSEEVPKKQRERPRVGNHQEDIALYQHVELTFNFLVGYFDHVLTID